jgi:hypothetical protein
LSPSERFAFDELVESKAEAHFYTFARIRVLSGSVDQRVPVTSLALFFHQYPAAYERWRVQEEAYAGSRRRIGNSRPRRMTWGMCGFEW